MDIRFIKNQKFLMNHAVFGKLPDHLEFIRINAGAPMIQELDHCVQEALEQAAASQDWKERFDATPPMDLCMNSVDGKWIFLGSLRASRDGSGRRYPLIAGTVLPAQVFDGDQSTLPLGGELFFEAARQTLAQVLVGHIDASECESFLGEYESTWENWPMNHDLAKGIALKFMESNHPRALESPFLAKGMTLYQAILNLVFYRDFLRRFQSPATLQIVEIPLKVGRGETLLHASVWLHVLSELFGCGTNARLDSLIQHDPRHARLLLTFGRGMSRTLALAFGGVPETSQCLDLAEEQAAWKSHRLYPETAYALQRLFDDPQTTLAGLRAFIQDLCKKQL